MWNNDMSMKKFLIGKHEYDNDRAAEALFSPPSTLARNEELIEKLFFRNATQSATFIVEDVSTRGRKMLKAESTASANSKKHIHKLCHRH